MYNNRKEMIKISVIIPCYNLGQYLQGCLDGILQQNIDDVEYIFINDGSTDDTLQSLTEFCKNRSNCKLINQLNAGVSAARNRAMECARGEYIYLLDGDDILTEDAVASMIAAVKDSTCDAVLSEVTILKDGIEKRVHLPIVDGTYSPKQIYEEVTIFPLMPQLLYKTEIIRNQNLKFDTQLKYGEVYDFTIRFFCFAKHIKVVSQCFFKYVMRSESATHAPNYKKDLTILDTLRKYNRVGVQFYEIPSFKLTAFKMIMSFTYNKYVKLRLKDKEAIDNIQRLLEDSILRDLTKEIMQLSSAPLKDRLLALYVYITGLSGYKFLTKLR